MPLPEFDTQEMHLLLSLKTATQNWITGRGLAHIPAALLIFGLSAYHDNIPMMIFAFLLVCGYRVYEERAASKWLPVYRSIFAKYEAACGGVAITPEKPQN